MTPRLILLALLAAVIATAQTEQKSPAELIRFLSYPPDRPVKPLREFGQFSCGWENYEVQQDRAAAAALLKFGPAAMPSIGAPRIAGISRSRF